MKGGGRPQRGDTSVEWRTGTTIDQYTPLYKALMSRGLKPHEADLLDLTTTAVLLGVAASGPATKQPERIPSATTTRDPRAPNWWPTEEAVTASNLQAARQFGYVIGSELTQ